MLGQVEAWAAIDSGSRNLAGLAKRRGVWRMPFRRFRRRDRRSAPVEAVDANGQGRDVAHGRHLRLAVRPEAPLQMLFTGHMDTVFGADHPFQSMRWLEPGGLNGPGVADMKGGIAVMLAALKAVEASRWRGAIGYEVMINSDEEVGSLGSAALIAAAARGKRAAFTYEPSALPDGTFAGARPGSGNFSFIVTGKSAHAGRNPRTGATRWSPRPILRCG